MSVVTLNQYWEDQTEFRKKILAKMPRVQYATVVELTPNGAPIIQFGEDALPDPKIYPRLKSYVPEIGERIMLINDVILGGVKIDY